jgi:hypothetical protein
VDYKIEIFNENLAIKLGTLLSAKDFWCTASHYERQKSFTLSNNYYAHQVNSAVIELCDALKNQVSIVGKESKNLCNTYDKYETANNKIDYLNNVNKILDGVLTSTKFLKKGYKDIGKELNKPDPAGNNDYRAIYNRIKEISQEMLVHTEVLMSMSSQLGNSLKEIKEESKKINSQIISGDIKANNGVMNFLKKKLFKNKEKNINNKNKSSFDR